MQKLTTFYRAIPLLRVRSLDAAVRFYTNVLGFTLDWQEGGVVSVTRDECSVFLSEDEHGTYGARVSVNVGDVQSLFDEMTLKGARVQPPVAYPRATVLEIEDLDGNILRFASSHNDRH